MKIKAEMTNQENPPQGSAGLGQIADKVAIHPPDAAAIQALRNQHNLSQRQCAEITGVAVRTWERYEYLGSDEKMLRNPSPQLWGIFLLALGQHPEYQLVPRQKGN